ncbi:MAG: bifunctional folylpolyglutamate synthase/dihydrofolate synthase [Desulfuromonadales bacterium]|nr:bifunctional folylpolyglutamate synthase/dihydrofolate synthase [Desulfuromonadales bacterium]
MDFRESLEFLYGLQRFGIKLGLENTRTLLERAGTPQQHFQCVHVAGTNGKGSTAAFLSAILLAAGYRVGLYTSPHLQSFCERIRINGTAISEAEIAILTNRLRPLGAEIPVTFFEFTTVMALCAFAEHNVDIAILETGLGGRLDATNAVTASLSLITPISLDHQEHLGQTLTAIAGEKAGIIKEGIPVICSAQEEEVIAVIRQQAAICRAPLLCAGRDFSVTVNDAGSFDYQDHAEHRLQALVSGLPGDHQPHNAALAITAAFRLRQQGLNISDAAIRQGLTGVYWPGRLEWWGGKRQILLDGAHNAAGAAVLAAYLKNLNAPALHWLVGVKHDKNFHEILTAILPLTTRFYAVAPPEVKATEPETLVTVARRANVPAQAFASVAEGLQAARSACKQHDIILVAGSLFLVGAAREILCKEEERS